jgi:hypothetical protein
MTPAACANVSSVTKAELDVVKEVPTAICAVIMVDDMRLQAPAHFAAPLR